MTGWQILTSAWEFHPSVVAGCLLVAGAYFASVRFRFDLKTAWFLSGVATTFLALVSPLDPLGDDYLFSAHMLQHILLDMVAPAFFVLGLPAALVRSWLRAPAVAQVERILGYPPVAWVLGTGTLLIWHLPSLYQATLDSENIHIFEHLTFLVTGTILWWPVLAPEGLRRLAPLPAVAYLLLAALPNGFLGAVFSIASTPYYAGYIHPDDELGILSLIRNTWGLDVVDDQKLGGGFMWVIGSAIYLWVILAVVARWYREPEEKDEG